MDSKRFQELVEESTFNHRSFADLFTCGVCDMKMWADNIHEHLQSHVSVCTNYQFNNETRTIMPVFDSNTSASQVVGQKRKQPMPESVTKQKVLVKSPKRHALFGSSLETDAHTDEREHRTDIEVENYLNSSIGSTDRLSVILDQHIGAEHQIRQPTYFAAKPHPTSSLHSGSIKSHDNEIQHSGSKYKDKATNIGKENGKALIKSLSGKRVVPVHSTGVINPSPLSVGDTVTHIDLPYVVEGKELGTYHCAVVIESFTPKDNQRTLPARDSQGKFQKITEAELDSSNDEEYIGSEEDDSDTADFKAVPLHSELENAIHSISGVKGSHKAINVPRKTPGFPNRKQENEEKVLKKRGRKVQNPHEATYTRSISALRRSCTTCCWIDDNLSALINSELKKAMRHLCARVPTVYLYFQSVVEIEEFDISKWAFRDLDTDLVKHDIGTDVQIWKKQTSVKKECLTQNCDVVATDKVETSKQSESNQKPIPQSAVNTKVTTLSLGSVALDNLNTPTNVLNVPILNLNQNQGLCQNFTSPLMQFVCPPNVNGMVPKEEPEKNDEISNSNLDRQETVVKSVSREEKVDKSSRDEADSDKTNTSEENTKNVLDNANSQVNLESSDRNMSSKEESCEISCTTETSLTAPVETNEKVNSAANFDALNDQKPQSNEKGDKADSNSELSKTDVNIGNLKDTSLLDHLDYTENKKTEAVVQSDMPDAEVNDAGSSATSKKDTGGTKGGTAGATLEDIINFIESPGNTQTAVDEKSRKKYKITIKKVLSDGKEEMIEKEDGTVETKEIVEETCTKLVSSEFLSKYKIQPDKKSKIIIYVKNRTSNGEKTQNQNDSSVKTKSSESKNVVKNSEQKQKGERPEGKTSGNNLTSSSSATTSTTKVNAVTASTCVSNSSASGNASLATTLPAVSNNIFVPFSSFMNLQQPILQMPGQYINPFFPNNQGLFVYNNVLYQQNPFPIVAQPNILSGMLPAAGLMQQQLPSVTPGNVVAGNPGAGQGTGKITPGLKNMQNKEKKKVDTGTSQENKGTEMNDNVKTLQTTNIADTQMKDTENKEKKTDVNNDPSETQESRIDSETRLRCYICELKFDSRAEYHSHNSANHTHKEILEYHLKEFECYVCVGCGIRKQIKRKFKSHVRECKGAAQCGFNKFNLNNYKNKPFLFSKGQMHECPYCDFARENERAVKRHILTCKNGPILQCDMCPYQSHSEKVLGTHKQKMHNVKAHQCTICQRSFPHTPALSAHMKLKHEGVAIRKKQDKFQEIICEKCGKIYFSKRYYEAHLRKMHSKTWPCLYCDLVFMYNTQRHVHEGVHTGDYSFSCVTCRKVFASRLAYHSHMKKLHHLNSEYSRQINTVVRKLRGLIFTYVCTLCKESFLEDGLYLKHMAVRHSMTGDQAKSSRLVTLQHERIRMYHERVEIGMLVEIDCQTEYRQRKVNAAPVKKGVEKEQLSIKKERVSVEKEEDSLEKELVRVAENLVGNEEEQVCAEKELIIAEEKEVDVQAEQVIVDKEQDQVEEEQVVLEGEMLEVILDENVLSLQEEVVVVQTSE